MIYDLSYDSTKGYVICSNYNKKTYLFMYVNSTDTDTFDDEKLQDMSKIIKSYKEKEGSSSSTFYDYKINLDDILN